MDMITWDDEYNLDIELIDSQHQELCKIINKLGNAMDLDEDKEILSEIVQELIDYATYHFSVEEEYFKEFDYSEQEEHIGEHKYFLDYFAKIKQGFENKDSSITSDAKLSMDILKYLVTWFVTHITGIDREYIELFKENGVV